MGDRKNEIRVTVEYGRMVTKHPSLTKGEMKMFLFKKKAEIIK